MCIELNDVISSLQAIFGEGFEDEVSFLIFICSACLNNRRNINCVLPGRREKIPKKKARTHIIRERKREREREGERETGRGREENEVGRERGREIEDIRRER